MQFKCDLSPFWIHILAWFQLCIKHVNYTYAFRLSSAAKVVSFFKKVLQEEIGGGGWG